jgi:hypothetical protein
MATVLAAAAACGLAATATATATAAEVPRPEVLAQIAREAYIWGYPLVLVDATRKVITNVEAPLPIGRAPRNQFTHLRAFPPSDFRDIVRPNFDTLYSAAFLDLSAGPLVLTLPKTDRYHVFQMMDAWSEVFAAPGTRADGGSGGPHLVAGPGWAGEVPAGMSLLRSPTDLVWIIGRIQTNGPSDYAFVHGLQAKVGLTPLARWGQPYEPPKGTIDPSVDMATPPMVVVDRMNASQYFTAMMEATRRGQPLPHDAAMVARLRRIGLEPGKGLDFAALPADVRQALDDAVPAAQAAIRKHTGELGRRVNGWQVMTGAVGAYGADTLGRAAVGMYGLGANRPEDAVYPACAVDADGQPLDGRHRYTLTFPKGQAPPVDAFWSLTLYDAQGFPVANPLNRSALGDRDALRFAPDGSLTLLIQHDAPGGDADANWLPAPDGPFTLLLRCYSPRDAITSGAWTPPAVSRVK